MFRKMRRFNQQLSDEQVKDILVRNTNGILAVLGDEDYPYAVPLSYVYDQNCIYFHCAKTGHKLDAIEKSSKVSFCVVDQDIVVPEELTTRYISVIAFGKASIMPDDEQKKEAILLLSKKYNPNNDQFNDTEIERFWKALCMVKIDIEHVTGKASLEIMKQNNNNK